MGLAFFLGMNIWLKPDRSGVSVLFPNDEYWIDQDTTLANYPVVIKSRNKIVYCDFEDFSHVLEKVDDDYDYKFLSRKFFNMETKQYQTAEIMFADLAHTDNKPSPWIFMCEDLEKCRARSTNDNLLKILNIDLTENDLWVRVERNWNGITMPQEYCLYQMHQNFQHHLMGGILKKMRCTDIQKRKKC